MIPERLSRSIDFYSLIYPEYTPQKVLTLIFCNNDLDYNMNDYPRSCSCKGVTILTVIPDVIRPMS